MLEAEFDRFAAEYQAQHAASIRLSGEKPDFFAKYKIDDVVWAGFIRTAFSSKAQFRTACRVSGFQGLPLRVSNACAEIEDAARFHAPIGECPGGNRACLWLVLNSRWTFRWASGFRAGVLARYVMAFLLAYGVNVAILLLFRALGFVDNPLTHLVGINRLRCLRIYSGFGGRAFPARAAE